jgi:plastocyanin
MSMHRRLASLRPLALGWALVLLAAGCSSGPATWTFQPTPEATAAPSASASTAACSADATVVKIEETAALKMVPATVDIPAGKKVCFEVTNTAGFTHNFYVGPQSDIDARNKTASVVGTPDFSSGTQIVEFTPSGSGPFEYACWIAGHLEAGMKGAITVQ